jgi:AcrR family transcriptional regulator
MSIKERKEKEKKDMRALILDAARALFFEHGLAQVTIRNIALAIEYSPRTIYLYFPNKDAILHTLQEEGFQTLFHKQVETQWIPDSLDRLKAQGIAYVMFALRNPEFYRLMFNVPVPHSQGAASAPGTDYGQESYLFLQNNIKECMEKDVIPAGDLQVATLTVWATVHGVSTLVGRQALPGLPEEEQKRCARRSVLYLAQLLHKK